MAVREYIGARYVPKFMGTYDPTQDYEALSVVDNGLGTSYTSKIPTPAGTPLTDTTYWIKTGDTNGAIIHLQDQIDAMKVNPTVADLQANTKLVAGDVAYTSGFYSPADGGAATYIIDSTGTPDNMFCFGMSSGLFAKLVYGDDLNILQIGAHSDGLTDDTLIIQAAINNARHIIIPTGTFLITNTLQMTDFIVISGVCDDFDRSLSVIKTTNDITMLSFENVRGGVTISDIVLQHEQSQTRPVTIFTGARYVKMIDVKFDHTGDSNCSAIWSDPLSADWTGYLIFDTVYCSNYKHSIDLTTATLCNCVNCKFNNTTDHNIVYKGEILTMTACELTNAIHTPPIKYEGVYGVSLNGCYAEDIRVPDLIEHSGNENLAYLINNGMKYSWTRIANSYGGYARTAAFKPEGGTTPAVLNRYRNGYDGDSYIQNGNFLFDTLGWTIDAAANAVVQDCFDHNDWKELYCQPSGGCDIKQSFGNLPAGKWTFAAWIKIEDASEGFSFNMFVNDANDSNNIYGRSSISSLDILPNGEWRLVALTFDAPHDPSAGFTQARIRVNATVPKIHIAGVTLCPGVRTQNVVKSSAANSLYADKLIVRGQDSRLYRIQVNGGTITATDVTP